MKLLCKYSIETEASRLLDSLGMVAEGFYTQHGFYVLPYLKQEFIDKPVIVVPPLEYYSFDQSWKVFEYWPTKTDTAAINEKNIPKIVDQLYKKALFVPLSEKYLKEFTQEVHTMLEPVLEKAEALLPYLKGRNVTFTVHPTHFGSGGSFTTFDFIHNKDKDINLYLYKRVDQPKEELIELFSSSITRGIFKPSHSWRDTEAVSDFFTKYVFDLNPSYVGTIERLQNIDLLLLQQSLNYLLELNAPLGTPLYYNKTSNHIYLINKNISTAFSPYEFRFMKILILHANESVCFDSLANEMYNTKSDIKYSLWGITKTAQRVRDKLSGLGLPRNIVCNVKGEGFMLRN